MSRDKLVVGVLLLDLLAVTVYAVVTQGVGGFVSFFTEAGGWDWQIFSDLVIALLLCCGWMWRDAKRRGASAAPYIALTLVAGSFGPLVYLLRRPGSEPT